MTIAASGCGSDTTSPPPASKLVFTSQPTTSSAGRVFSPTVVITLQDESGERVRTSDVTVTIAVSGNGTILGTTSVRAVTGIATFTDLRITSAGAGYTLTASADGMAAVTSSTFDITPGPAIRLGFVVQPATAIANTILPDFSVAIQDAFGNTMTTSSGTIAVGIASTTSVAALAGTTTVPTVNGVAVFSGVRVTRPGTALRVTAQSGSLTSATSNPFDATVGPATRLAFVVEPVAANPGRTLSSVTVIVADAAGNRIESAAAANVTLRLGSNPSGGALSGQTTQTTVQGTVAFSDLSINNAGSGYTLIASAPNLTSGESAPFDVRNPLVFASVVAGYFHTCGVTTTSQTYCWGSNATSALGNDTPEQSLVPVVVSGSNSFVRISAGRDHTCGTTSGGVGYCWGGNGNGQLGPAALSPSTKTPTAVSSQISFAAVDAGYSHTCGIASTGAAYCWGSNSLGELGNPPSSFTTTPLPVAGGFTFTSISPGRLFTCGITTGGAAYCWGDNNSSELGIGGPGNKSAPTAVAGGLSFSAISAGGFHACGLTTTGAAYCWGQNLYGQLGNNSTSNSNGPVPVAGGKTFASISAGNRHTCAVTSGGTAFCWGENTEGKLGVGGTTNSVSPLAVVGNLTFRSVSAGRFHTCGITTAGLAYCWGAAALLGDGTTNEATVPVAVR
ncbi:MAG TPA: hypothetical protein VM166_03620 [Gemmatimonadaceae bacterium]|nr:hypothetical protein [Gemmatimonadaceae bacterium]